MYEDACYKKTFLKDVIFRLDFGSSVEAFQRALPQKLATAALQQFPISEPQKGRAQKFVVSDTDVQTETKETVQWAYHGRNREKTLIISSDEIIVSNRKYESFESFRKDIDEILRLLFATQKDLSVGRFGLRYINVLEIPDGNPLSWSEYVNGETLGIIDLNKDTEAISRAFHVIEFNYDGQQVKVQFGIQNPDYPAPVKRRQFVLDIDVFVHGALSYEDVCKHIDAAHERIQDFFENSITDKTRTLMEPSRQ